jgi:pimeloyl-ACP methyl ester carboxylesterase
MACAATAGRRPSCGADSLPILVPMADSPIVFGTGRGLFGMLTKPDAQPRRRGVVVCAPFGHPNVCSYRPLRTLARRLGSEGWPVLRFDWPGTGDSGDPDDGANRLDVWIVALTEAVAELRARTCVDDVALVGMGIGATLALAYTERRRDVTDIVLLDPYANGKAYLREARARNALAQGQVTPADAAPPPPEDGTLELSGFLVSREEVEALTALDVKARAVRTWAGRRVLAVTARDDHAVGLLVTHLTAAGADVMYTVSDALDQAWKGTENSSMPPATSGLVCDWLAAAATSAPSARRTSDIDAKAHVPDLRSAVDCDGCRERPIVLDTAHGSLVGILCEPDTLDRGNDWIVFVNAGRARRIGPNRMMTEYARTWARDGLPSLRLDLPGIGDSDGGLSDDEPPAYDPHWYRRPEFASSIRAALDMLAGEHEAQRFVLVGLSSGAWWAFHVAQSDERVAAAALVNPLPLDLDGHGALSHAWDEVRRMARSPRAWTARHRIPGVGNGGARQRQSIEAALAGMRSRGALVGIVFSDGDPGIAYFQEHLGADCRGELERFGAMVDVIRGPDGVFRPPWSREVLQQVIERQLVAAGFLDDREADSGDT